jgi:apolipoprotein N-acyltransferase
MATIAPFGNSPIDSSTSLGARPSRSWLWLLCGTGLLLFADGRNTIALAAWLVPALLLRFVRTQPAMRGLAVVYVTMMVMRGVAMRGMIPIPGVFYYLFMVISGISALLPYIADRFVTPHLKGVFNTLVFPCTLVAAQFVYSHGPMGSWGSIPYTQAGNLPLLQLLALTGLWGITFLIGWFAAVVNWTWQRGFDRQARHPLTLFIGIYLVVILMGAARLVLFSSSSPTVRVASLSPTKEGPKLSDDLLKAVIGGKANDREISQFRTVTSAGQDDLLARSEREATAGAKIIFWSETGAFVLRQDEPDLLARGRALASKNHIYLGMALGTWTPAVRYPLENKFVLIEPSGQIAWQYLKARPTPGPEAAMSVKSDGRLRQLDTSYGRLNAAICYDTDFPRLMAQAGALKADLVLSPAGDWRAIDPRHTEIASFRAIEQGFNLVRQSNGGLSAAYDYQGRQLASMDEYQSADLTLIAQVPTRGVRTIYSHLGDWFAWVCVVSTFVLMGFAFREARKPAFV